MLVPIVLFCLNDRIRNYQVKDILIKNIFKYSQVELAGGKHLLQIGFLCFAKSSRVFLSLSTQLQVSLISWFPKTAKVPDMSLGRGDDVFFNAFFFISQYAWIRWNDCNINLKPPKILKNILHVCMLSLYSNKYSQFYTFPLLLVFNISNFCVICELC